MWSSLSRYFAIKRVILLPIDNEETDCAIAKAPNAIPYVAKSLTDNYCAQSCQVSAADLWDIGVIEEIKSPCAGKGFRVTITNRDTL